MLGVQAFPSLIFLVLIRFIPESPRWLILKKQATEKALEILRIINPLNCDQELISIQNSSLDSDGNRHQKESIFSGHYSKPILLAILFSFFNLSSAFNPIFYYP